MSKVQSMKVQKADGKRLEEEARMMEARLGMLRNVIEEGGDNRAAGGGRWSSATKQKPLRRNYVNDVITSKIPPQSKRSSSGETQTGAPPPRSSPGAALGGVAASAAAAAESRVAEGGTRELSLHALKPPAGWAPTEPGVGDSPTGGAAGGGMARDTLGGSSAARNLGAALAQQEDESREVEAFLTSLGLSRYFTVFLEQGFESMESVEEMEEQHMKELGMLAGHVLKLKKHLAERRGERTSPSRAPGDGESRPIGGTPQNQTSTRRSVNFAEPEAASGPPPRPAVVGYSSGGQGGSLLDGTYDEAANAASFKEAVMAWRTGKNAEAVPGSSSSASASATDTADLGGKPKAGFFFASMGNEHKEGGNGFTMPSFCHADEGGEVPGAMGNPSEDARTETVAGTSPSGRDRDREKACCYECFKQVFAEFAIEREDQTLHVVKKFCSEGCVERFEQGCKRKQEIREQRGKQHEKMRVLAEATGMDLPQGTQESEGAVAGVSELLDPASAVPATTQPTAGLFALAAAM